MTVIRELLGVELPILQAPMAGVQAGALAIAVSNAGGLGALPCAMLSAEQMRAELAAIRTATNQPFQVNFFCHTPPEPDAVREAAWRGPHFGRIIRNSVSTWNPPVVAGAALLSARKLRTCWMSSGRLW